ncbi:MAG: bifunctional helix-turn-helix transcriptional regulator/GNAT family N-acetyltransferase [Pyrinomonadaceae bacterium]
MESTDFLRELGFLSFVTRLKRLSDTMIHDGRKMYRELGMDIEPNWFVIFKLFETNDELTVMEIAEKIGFAHPSVITIVNKMVKRGYLRSRQCDDDSRRRILVLTKKSHEKLPEFEKVWTAGIAGMKKMLLDTNAPEFLDLLESRIAESGFRERTLKCVEPKRDVKIIRFESKYARDFAEVNYEWLEEFFSIEDHDREQLDNAESYIIKTGGQILLARIDDVTVGTAALIATPDPDEYELAKMAVRNKYRGYSVGKKLMIECIEYAKAAGKKFITLESNRKQIPAINMYKNFGFVEIERDPNSQFARSDIRMRLTF